jgi:hypothetical protein
MAADAAAVAAAGSGGAALLLHEQASWHPQQQQQMMMLSRTASPGLHAASDDAAISEATAAALDAAAQGEYQLPPGAAAAAAALPSVGSDGGMLLVAVPVAQPLPGDASQAVIEMTAYLEGRRTLPPWRLLPLTQRPLVGRWLVPLRQLFVLVSGVARSHSDEVLEAWGWLYALQGCCTGFWVVRESQFLGGEREARWPDQHLCVHVCSCCTAHASLHPRLEAASQTTHVLHHLHPILAHSASTLPAATHPVSSTLYIDCKLLLFALLPFLPNAHLRIR